MALEHIVRGANTASTYGSGAPVPAEPGIFERALNNLQAIQRALECAKNLRRRVVQPESSKAMLTMLEGNTSPPAPDHVVFVQREQSALLEALNSILDDIERAL